MNGYRSIAKLSIKHFISPTNMTRSAILGLLTLGLIGCGGGGSGSNGGSGTATEHTITTTAGSNGSIVQDATQSVSHGDSTEFTITPDALYAIDTVAGTCGGTLSGNTYTTSAVTSDCTILVSFGPPDLTLTPTAIKNFSFRWNPVSAVTEYQILENPDGMSGYTPVATIDADNTNHDLEVFLPGRINASYILTACNSEGCSDSEPMFVSGTLAGAVGYVKASNTDADDHFSLSVALSNDGNTMAVGAANEDSNAAGINGDHSDNSANASGAVYIFTRSDRNWSQKAYLKASNSEIGDNFGVSVALAEDGNTLAVGASNEASNATGINGDQANNSANGSGAVYMFTRTGASWTQLAYLKASNTDSGDNFGLNVTLANDGNTLAVGALAEASNAIGIDGDQSDNSSTESGAVYVFTRSTSSWTQQAYIKASNSGAGDLFGRNVVLADNGTTLAVSAYAEASNATGIDGNQFDNSALFSGAVYVFNRIGADWSQEAYIKASNTEAISRFGGAVTLSADGDTMAVGAYFENGVESLSGAAYVFSRSNTNWSQQAYLKASNIGANDRFGASIALTDDGNTLAVGSMFESSNAVGIDGDQTDNSVFKSGAVYLFIRSGGSWAQKSYIKAPNTELEDHFGYSLSIAGDGSVLAVGAYLEDGNATSVDGAQADNSVSSSGAVYLY